MLNQSQWTLATIIEDYAVKNRKRSKVILVPGNAQNAGFYTIYASRVLGGPQTPAYSEILPPTQIYPDNIKWLEKLMGVKDKYI